MGGLGMGEIKIVQSSHIPGKVKISGPGIAFDELYQLFKPELSQCLRMPICTALSFAFTLGAYYALEVKKESKK